ncbi:MAG: DUF5519 family protein [Nitrososphaera sp.]|nr:DUF5519 family protein [Nitrososphaera sp.]
MIIMASKSRTASGSGIFEIISGESMSWPGVISQPHKFGGIEFRASGREMGHLHGDQLADLPFPKDVGRKLIEEGRASHHQVLPESGWVSYYIDGDEDVQDVI